MAPDLDSLSHLLSELRRDGEQLAFLRSVGERRRTKVPRTLSSHRTRRQTARLRTAHKQPTFCYVLGECLGRATWRHRRLPQEIAGNLVEADGSNENYH